MCTVSWLREEHVYTLFCNRDELRTRKPAGGARLGVLRGINFMAPVDGDHGGSWIGVNEMGVTLCLLNRYGDPQIRNNGEFVSRGLLLTDLLDCRGVEEVKQRLSSRQLEEFRPFTLVTLGVAEPALEFDWYGGELVSAAYAEENMPIVSSSFRDQAVGAGRKMTFADLLIGAGQVNVSMLEKFHRSHTPEAGPYSVCMHRVDAQTVSLSRITVGPESIVFDYHPDSPCKEVPEQKIIMSRAIQIERAKFGD